MKVKQRFLQFHADIHPVRSTPTRKIAGMVPRKFVRHCRTIAGSSGSDVMDQKQNESELVRVEVREFTCNDTIARFDISGLAALMHITHSNRVTQLIYTMPLGKFFVPPHPHFPIPEFFESGDVIFSKARSIDGCDRETYLLSLDALRGFAASARNESTRANALRVIKMLEMK
jgi:hypothetical protein